MSIVQWVIDGILSGSLLLLAGAGARAYEHLAPEARCQVCGTPHPWSRRGTCPICNRPYPLPPAPEPPQSLTISQTPTLDRQEMNRYG